VTSDWMTSGDSSVSSCTYCAFVLPTGALVYICHIYDRTFVCLPALCIGIFPMCYIYAYASGSGIASKSLFLPDKNFRLAKTWFKLTATSTFSSH